MTRRNLTRRGLLQGLAAVPLSLPAMPRSASAAAPAAAKVTPELIVLGVLALMAIGLELTVWVYRRRRAT